MAQSIREALVKSPAGDRLGKSGLGEDFLRGWSGFYINSRIAWNDLTNDVTERDEWRGHMQNLRQYLPGSTGGQAGFVSELAEGAGGMAPQMIASLGTGGAGLVSGETGSGCKIQQIGIHEWHSTPFRRQNFRGYKRQRQLLSHAHPFSMIKPWGDSR